MSEPLYPRTISFTVDSLEDLDATKLALDTAKAVLSYEAHQLFNDLYGTPRKEQVDFIEWRTERIGRHLDRLNRVLSSAATSAIFRSRGDRACQ